MSETDRKIERERERQYVCVCLCVSFFSSVHSVDLKKKIICKFHLGIDLTDAGTKTCDKWYNC